MTDLRQRLADFIADLPDRFYYADLPFREKRTYGWDDYFKHGCLADCKERQKARRPSELAALELTPEVRIPRQDLFVPCETCNAKVHQPCTTADGKVTSTHQPRRDAADRMEIAHAPEPVAAHSPGEDTTPQGR